VTDEIRLEPVVARQGAQYLTDAGRQVSQARRTLGAELEDEAAARPWGHDDIGAAFQTNYDQAVPMVLAAWPKLGEYLEYLGSAVTAAADAAVAENEAARQRMTW
jgi:hypothetical protein